jgi:hypothetical protein
MYSDPSKRPMYSTFIRTPPFICQFCKCLRHGNSPRKPDISRAGANTNGKRARRHNPVLPGDIPVTQIFPTEVERRRATGSGREAQLGEAAELLRGSSWGRRWESDVQLSDLRAGYCTRVRDRRRDRGDRVEQIGSATGDDVTASSAGRGSRCHGDIGVGKVGVCCTR